MNPDASRSRAAWPPLRSALAESVWPAVPNPQAALLMALQYQLEESQWWPQDRLLEHQHGQLAGVLRHAWESVPFYRDRLAAAGYDPAARPQAEHAGAVLARMPPLARADIQAAGTALHARNLPAGHGQPRRGETSGSTGRPIVFLSSDLESLHWNAYTLRDHLWHGRDLGAKLCAIRFAKQEGALPGWGPATDAIFVTGPSAMLSISTPIEKQIEWLQRERPAYLLSYPSNLEALAEACVARGAVLEGLREVRTVSETLKPGLREKVRHAWNVPLTDIYSTKEAGYLALQCPRHEHYHVLSEHVIVEILDAQGAPCAPGQAGRMVITTLHKFAMPLIRYEIGDYGVAGAPCDCGRGLPVLEQILGRQRNMMRLPDGGRRWPLCDLTKMPDIPGVVQYQYRQAALDTLEVSLVTGPDFRREDEPRLTAFIHRKLEYPFNIRYRYCSEIARGAEGKFEDFICAVPE